MPASLAPIQSPLVANGQPKRLECLDSIRGLAALAVLLSHTVGAFDWPHYLLGWREIPVINMIVDGPSAVAMFFVLSGFVLSHPYLTPKLRGGVPKRLHTPSFYIRRITRIWLPWFFAFLLSLLAQRFFFSTPATTPPITDWLAGFWHVPISLTSFLRQCCFLEHDARILLLNQDWSLGVELKGSALIPLFLFLIRRSGLAFWLAALALLIMVPTGKFYISFAVGVWTARNYHIIGPRIAAFSSRSKGWWLAAGILLYETRMNAVWFGVPTLTEEKITWSFTSIGCVLIIITTLASRRLQAKLHLPLVLFLGRISYSVYLLQFIVILCLLPSLVHACNSIGIHFQPFLFLVTILVAVLVTIAMGMIMYHFIEVPSINLGHWLARRIQQRQTPPESLA